MQPSQYIYRIYTLNPTNVAAKDVWIDSAKTVVHFIMKKKLQTSEHMKKFFTVASMASKYQKIKIYIYLGKGISSFINYKFIGIWVKGSVPLLNI